MDQETKKYEKLYLIVKSNTRLDVIEENDEEEDSEDESDDSDSDSEDEGFYETHDIYYETSSFS